MPMPWRPWFEWGDPGSEVPLSLAHPMRPWDPEDGGVGGNDTAASGIEEAFRIREDHIVRLELRMMEHELDAFRFFLRWARRSGQTFRFRFDQDLPATEYEVLLESPRWQDGSVRYRRDSEFPHLFVVPIAVRTDPPSPITTRWSVLEEPS